MIMTTKLQIIYKIQKKSSMAFVVYNKNVIECIKVKTSKSEVKSDDYKSFYKRSQT